MEMSGTEEQEVGQAGGWRRLETSLWESWAGAPDGGWKGIEV